MVGGGSLQPDPIKVLAAKEYPRLVTKTDVQAFLGLVGYYRRFITNFASVAAPPTDITQKGQPHQVDWGDKQEVAFQQLKHLITSAPVLRVADPTKPYILQTDASDLGLGAVLSQEDEQLEENPVTFASHKLLPHEMRRSMIEKECLAMVWALQFFHAKPVWTIFHHRDRPSATCLATEDEEYEPQNH